jgi:1,4-dihydroxy-2-naphthoyl-CoA hydrolase
MAGAAGGPGPEEDRWGRVLGLEMLEVGPERVRARLEVGPQHHQPYGIAHGGVYCSSVEGVASYGAGVAARARGLAGVVGVSNTTDFLRSHGEGELVAEGRPLHAGRTQQLWEVTIVRSSDGKLVARGQVRFQTLEELPDARARRLRGGAASPKPRGPLGR